MDGAGHLFERGDELDRLSALVDSAAEGSGGVVVVAGEAGIGKSRLIAAAAGFAAQRGVAVVRARGTDVERHFAHGVVRQLFEREARGPDGPALLAGAAAPAGPLLGAVTAAAPARDESAVDLAHAVYWLTVELGARRPLLICIDDAHWADAPSWVWIVHLARRLDGLPVSLLVGWRTGEAQAPEDAFAALREDAGTEVLSPAELGPEACAAMVRSALGNEADPGFVGACRQASGGNPFYLGELVRALASEGVSPTAESIERVTGRSPETVSRSVLARIARLSGEAVAVARAVAVLDTEAAPRVVAELAQLPVEGVLIDVERLAEAHVLDAGRALRFAHPIVRAGVYDALSAADRSTLHRRASDLLEADGRADAGAVHLLSVAPQGDPEVVQRLRDAAERASARGAPESAVPLLRRALDEPPPAAALPALVLALGNAERLVGEPGAVSRLQDALRIAPDDASREAVVQSLALALNYAGHIDDAVALLEDLIANTAPEDRERRLRLDCLLIVQGASSVRHGMRLKRRLGELVAGASGSTPAERALLAIHAANGAFARDVPAEEVSEVAWRAWADGRLVDDDGPDSPQLGFCTVALILVDAFERATEVTERSLHAASERGGVTARQMAAIHRGRLRWVQGELAAAEVDLRGALEVGVMAGSSMDLMYALWVLVTVLVQRGELDDAEELLHRHGVLHADPPTNLQSMGVLDARARLHLARGRPREARRDEETIRDAFRARGIERSATWARVLTLALLGDGDIPAARKYSATALAIARRSGVVAEEGLALAAHGLAEGGDRGLELLEQAAALMERSPRPLDRADVLCDLGAALRRANRRAEAREPLRIALDLARASGARLIADAAEQELRAAGARPRRFVLSGADSLTPSERRVAELAAASQTNRAIAQALFVTPKTVETHLRAAYRKLDIAGRAELAAKLDPGSATAGDGSLTIVLGLAGQAAEASSRQVVAEEAARHHGRLAGRHGGCALVAFDGATRAVRCAVAIQTRLAADGGAVRAGLHAGECTFADGVVSGAAVVVAAEVAAEAGAGEVLATSTVRELSDPACGLYTGADSTRVGPGDRALHYVKRSSATGLTREIAPGPSSAVT